MSRRACLFTNLLFVFVAAMLRSTQGADCETSVNGECVNLEIAKGRTKGGIDYYHCNGGTEYIVLLHGARFTKEDWKTSGILQQLCGQSLSVTALDLDVTANHDQLLTVLNDLKDQETIHLPIAALITPSASGFSVMQGIVQGQLQKATAAVQRWIPVASNRILQATQNPAFASAEIKAWPIMAIHGDKDQMGRRVSEFLRQTSNAAVKELPGRHPCYLDSPKAFVEAVVEFVSPSSKTAQS